VTQYLTISIGQSGLNLVVEGVIFLAVILLLPQGIVPAVRELIFKRFTGRDATPVAPAPSAPTTVPPAIEPNPSDSVAAERT